VEVCIQRLMIRCLVGMEEDVVREARRIRLVRDTILLDLVVKDLVTRVVGEEGHLIILSVVSEAMISSELCLR
jgi:hypothetical protein